MPTGHRALLALAQQYQLLEDGAPRKLLVAEPEKLLVFHRDGLIFLFNFGGHLESGLALGIHSLRSQYNVVSQH